MTTILLIFADRFAIIYLQMNAGGTSNEVKRKNRKADAKRQNSHLCLTLREHLI